MPKIIENLEPTVPIDISGIYFYPQKFAYDGKPHSVSCKGIPEGVVVEYEGNDVIEIGKYTVTAIIKDEKGRTALHYSFINPLFFNSKIKFLPALPRCDTEFLTSPSTSEKRFFKS